MSISWKECTPRDGWRCRSRRPIQAADMIGLTRLYQPLVGARAASLYTTLYYQLPQHRAGSSRIQSHMDLMKGLSLQLGEVLEARYLLEGVGLLNTFRCSEKGRKVLEYELVPPLTPVRFFQSDVLSISLLNRIGKDRFRALYSELLDISREEGRRGTSITKSFQQVFGSLSPSEVASAADLVGEWSPSEEGESVTCEEGKPPAFIPEEDDLSMVRARLSTLLHDSAWTSEVEERIREIRFLYQLDDWDLIRALQNPYVTQGGQIDIRRLRSFVRSQYQMRFGSSPVVVDRKQMGSIPSMKKEKGEADAVKGSGEPREEKKEAVPASDEEERHFRALSQLSPVELLSHFQKGKQIPRADLELVEDLTNEYGLPTGVINVLLEYVLYSYDYKLPRPLVEKIAGHWARKNIQTVKEAREMARKELNWEWNKRKGGGDQRSARKWSPWKNRREREEKLPKAVARSLEKKSGTNEAEWEVDPEAAAQIQAEIEQMHQSLSQRNKKKGNA
ncbi:replication initiation and membrane attachment family protein [Salinithrix halophila]|uniref:Replication initiation and membrane attachment family protein n=1 Tax=Salinithrix halophila TaxID=1485204 RepID=A0ABV8JBQ9_9BACL